MLRRVTLLRCVGAVPPPQTSQQKVPVPKYGHAYGRRPITPMTNDDLPGEGASLSGTPTVGGEEAVGKQRPGVHVSSIEEAKKRAASTWPGGVAPGKAHIKVGWYMRLHAWYLGVDPVVLARYGDGTQRFRMLRYLFLLCLCGFGAVELHATTDASLRRQQSVATLEDNRRRFYGHDFDQPMGDVSRNFGHRSTDAHYGDKEVVVEMDARTQLLYNADDRMIAPAKYERDMRIVSTEVTPEMMNRVSNLSKMSQGYNPRIAMVPDARFTPGGDKIALTPQSQQPQ